MVDDTSRFSSKPPLFPLTCSTPPSQQKIRELDASTSEEYISTEVVNPSIYRVVNASIYRVPNRIRDANPEAYTPQLLLIGPLNHHLKAQAKKCDITDKGYTKLMGYLEMEEHKESCFNSFSEKFKGENFINEFKRVIKENEEMIRRSYSKSTTLIHSEEFVEMILHDSVFILECLSRILDYDNIEGNSKRTRDVLMGDPAIRETFFEDLILLENQLPYFILQKLFDPIVPKIQMLFHPLIRNWLSARTFRDLIDKYFEEHGYKIKGDMDFIHFTDLLRCVRVETLKIKEKEAESESESELVLDKYRNFMYNAEKLENAGVKFEAIDETGVSLEVKFENGCLKLPCFEVDDCAERILRNIMAFELYHYPHQTHVCNFVAFMDFLIDTNKDVDILVGKGIIKNWMGSHGYVAEMVNKLTSGIQVGLDFSNYYRAATKANAYYEKSINRSLAMLKRVYFSDPWTGTATVAAMFLLLMTLIQTVVSVIQVLQK